MTLIEPAVFGAPSQTFTSTAPEVAVQVMYFAVPSSHTAPPRWIDAVDIEIKELLLLSEGWDGIAAYSVSTDAVDIARRLAAEICEAVPALRRPTVTPSINGRVVLEWHWSDRHVDFTVGRDSIEVFVEDEERCLDWEGPLADCPVDPLVVLATLN